MHRATRCRRKTPILACLLCLCFLLYDSKLLGLRQQSEKVLLLHMGKAGGGSIEHQMRQENVPFRRCHPEPCVPLLFKEKLYPHVIINIRDPVDRLVSAFYWRSLIFCSSDNEETRTTAWGRKYSEQPDKYCKPFWRDGRAREEIKMIRVTYQNNVSRLAEALCDDDDNPEATQMAKKTMKLIRHTDYSIADWLGESSNDNQDDDDNSSPSWHMTSISAVVLEPGFDVQQQAEGAIQLAGSKWRGGDQDLTKTKTSAYQTLMNKRYPKNEDKMRHSSHASNQTLPGLTEVGMCCLARYYRKDYQLIQELATRACQGEATDLCRSALESILQRRAYLLNDNVSCLNPPPPPKQ